MSSACRARRWLGLAAALPLAAGCATGGPPPRTAPAVPVDGAAGSQRLYRVQYDGPQGEGGLKLTLRLAAADRFVLSAADPLGRAQWSLRMEGSRVLVVDHRRREYCRSGAGIRVPEMALAELPVRSLPRVLLGRLPVPPSGELPADGEVEIAEELGGGAQRRWSARLEGGAPAAWTLWEGGEPLLWWQANPRGGVLSHRRGSQFRWRETVAEPLAELGAGGPPAGYRQVDCEGWSAADGRSGDLRRR